MAGSEKERCETQARGAAGRRGIWSLRLGGAEVERSCTSRFPDVHAEHAAVEAHLQRMGTAKLRQARRGGIAHEGVVAVIVAAERHEAADAKTREHQPIDVLVDRDRQAQTRRPEPEPLIVEDEQRPRESQPRIEHGRIRHRPVEVDDAVVGQILFVDAPLSDRDFLWEEGGRSTQRRSVRVAHEELLFVGELVIDARVEVVHVELGRSGSEVVVGSGCRVARLVGQRKVVQDLERDGIHPGRRDHVAGELIADEASGWIRAGRERIEESNELSVLRERLREVPLALCQRGNGRGRLRCAPLAQPLERGHEEGPAASNRTAGDPAELAPTIVAEGLIEPIREEVVRVECRVPEELVPASMELVRARLVDDVQDASEAAAVFGGVVGAEHLEFLDGVDRRKHRNTREPVHGGKGGRHAVDHGIHHRRAGTVHAVAHRVVVVSYRSGDARRQEDERVDVARIQGQLEDAAIVDDLADRAAGRLEQRGVGAHLDFVGKLADFEGEVDDERAVDLQDDVRARRAPESLETRFDAVPARWQRQRRVPAFEIRRHGLLAVRLLVRDGDCGVGNHSTARVFDRADERAGVGLREQDRRAHDKARTHQASKQAHGCPPDGGLYAPPQAKGLGF